MKKYSLEDLRAILEYLSSNPAIPFPELTRAESEKVIADALEQFEEEKHKDSNPDLIINLEKDRLL